MTARNGVPPDADQSREAVALSGVVDVLTWRHALEMSQGKSTGSPGWLPRLRGWISEQDDRIVIERIQGIQRQG
jgi:hypothetical protein